MQEEPSRYQDVPLDPGSPSWYDGAPQSEPHQQQTRGTDNDLLRISGIVGAGLSNMIVFVLICIVVAGGSGAIFVL